MIIPQYDYIALDIEKDNYLPLKKEELDSCYKISPGELICKQTFPIMSTANTDVCEIKLLKLDIISEECNIRISNLTHEMWIQLHEPNTYIFTFPRKQNLRVICDANHYDYTLIHSGRIRIAPGCRIKTNNLMINGFQTIISSVFRELIPIVKTHSNFTLLFNDLKIPKRLEIPNINYPNLISDEMTKELGRIGLSLAQVKQLEDDHDSVTRIKIKKPFIDIYKVVLFGLFIISLVFIIVFVVIKLILKID